jgi:hypothetical protein
MSISTATAAQRLALRDTALKVYRATQPFAQNAAVPAAPDSFLPPLTAMAAALSAVGVGSGDTPLALSALIVPWTDSRGAQNWTYSTTLPSPLSRGYLWRAEARSRRFRLDHKYSQAVSGDSIKQLRARMANDTVNAYGVKPSQVPPSLAFVLIGTNTGQAYSAATSGTVEAYVADMLVDVNWCLDWLLAKGHGVILCAEWPRGQTEAPQTAYLTPDAQRVMYLYANGLRQIVRKNVAVINVLPRTLDMTKTDYTPLPNMLNGDFLHNSPGIAEITSQEIERVAPFFGLPELSFSTAAALNSNPALLLGAGGTLGSNATGVVPEGYTLSASTGLAVVGSFTQVYVKGELRNAFKMVVSGTPTSANASAILRQSGLISKVVAGDTVEGWQEVFIGPGSVNFSSAGLMVDTALSATRLHGGLSISGDLICPVEVPQHYEVARTNYGTLATLPASLSFQFGAYFTLAAASSLTMYILSAALVKV